MTCTESRNRVVRPHASPILSDRNKCGKPTVVAQGKIDQLGDVEERCGGEDSQVVATEGTT